MLDVLQTVAQILAPEQAVRPPSHSNRTQTKFRSQNAGADT